jgi:chromosome segregation ATPase
MTPEDPGQPATRQQLREALDRAVESIAAEISNTRQELIARLDAADRRADRVADVLRNIDARISLLTKSADTFDRDNAALHSSFHEQQRAIQRLSTRVEQIERELHPPQ